MKQHVQDRITAAAGLVLVVLGWRLCGEYSEDSAFFPQVCLAGIGALLVLMVAESMLAARRAAAAKTEAQAALPMNWPPFLLVTGTLAAYGAALVILGFYTSSALFLIAVGFFWGGVKKPVILVFTACFLIFLYVCFTILFNVPLPAGIAR